MNTDSDLKRAPNVDASGMDEILDQAPCGFLSFADDGSVLLANSTLLDMLGYQRDELVGHRIETIMGVGSRIFYQTHLFPLVRLHGRAEEIFLLLRTRAGPDVGVLTNVVRRSRDGQTVNDCVFMRVVERQKFEQELLLAKKAAEQAQAALQAQTNELLHVNEQLEEQAMELEIQQQQLQEQTLALEAAHEELHAINDQLLERTEELEAQRRVAEEANRAKSTFLAVMSHELRTPLNAIAGYVQLLEMGIHGPVTPAQLEALGRVARSQRHLLRLINDVLNLARIEAGRVDYLIEDVSLASAIADVLPMVEPQLESKGLTRTVRVPDDLWIRADRDKVQQILINLLSNAVKFTPAGGEVSVTARPGEDGTARLEVTDSGIGIAPEKLDRVFEPFVQVDVSRTRSSEGTGLGLAISRDLARGMGGDLRARSVEGEGSTFYLILPRVDPPAADPA